MFFFPHYPDHGQSTYCSNLLASFMSYNNHYSPYLGQLFFFFAVRGPCPSSRTSQSRSASYSSLFHFVITLVALPTYSTPSTFAVKNFCWLSVEDSSPPQTCFTHWIRLFIKSNEIHCILYRFYSLGLRPSRNINVPVLPALGTDQQNLVPLFSVYILAVALRRHINGQTSSYYYYPLIAKESQ